MKYIKNACALESLVCVYEKNKVMYMSLCSQADFISASDIQLSQMRESELDELDFGVIGFDAATLVKCYNEHESKLAGLSKQRVIDQPLFTAVAPCMNNFLVAQRFEDAAVASEPLDITIDYVLTLRMRPVKVKMRLLASPGKPLKYILIKRQVSS
jgi:photoactive yellow protein